jgi:hypothetical protein
MAGGGNGQSPERYGQIAAAGFIQRLFNGEQIDALKSNDANSTRPKFITTP